MTLDINKLEAAAKAAQDAGGSADCVMDTWNEYSNEATPEAVQELINRLREAENKPWATVPDGHVLITNERYAELEEAEKDALRYRWLRERVGVNFEYGKGYAWIPCGRTKASNYASETDEAIDAAMKESA